MRWQGSTCRGTDRAIDRLVYAGLLHDFNHPGNPNDELNIKHTLSEIERLGFWDAFDIERANVEQYIKATQWPVDTAIRPTVRENIIRDADQLYATYFFSPAMSKALFAELGPRFGIEKYGEWLSRNVDYLFTLRDEMNTETASEVLESCLEHSVKVHFAEILAYCKELESTSGK